MTADVKTADINRIIKDINNKFGSGSALKLSDVADIEMLDTGIPQLNEALGVGGYPVGRIVDIFGEEGAGKSALALICAAKAQKNGLKVCYLDLEHRLSVDFAKMIGVNVDELVVIKPETGEAALDIIMDLVYDKKAGEARKLFDLIVFDSVAALVTQAELEGDINQQFVAPVAQKMSSALKKLVHWLYVTNTTIIFINQMRSKPMMMGARQTISTGGKALRFYASVRLEVKISDKIKQGDVVTGIYSEIFVEKNSVAAPYKTAKFSFSFESGLDFVQQVLDEAIEKEIIKVQSSWFYYGDTKWNGKAAVYNAMKSDQSFIDSLMTALAALKVKPVAEKGIDNGDK